MGSHLRFRNSLSLRRHNLHIRHAHLMPLLTPHPLGPMQLQTLSYLLCLSLCLGSALCSEHNVSLVSASHHLPHQAMVLKFSLF